jgi:tetratricopeptide (TPR) repeat protein
MSLKKQPPHQKGTGRTRTPRALSPLFAATLPLVIIAFLGWLTHARNGVYADSLALWDDTVRKSPEKGRAHYNRGTFLYHDGRMDDAIAALQRATKLRPDHFRSHFNLGMAYVRSGRLADAERSFRTALGPSMHY